MPIKINPANIGTNAEKNLAKRLGAKLNPASGSMSHAKGDMVINDIYLLECKATEKDSITIKLQTLAKITKEARTAGHLPLIALQYVDARGEPVDNGSWIALREIDFVDLLL